jgi:tyrosine-protein kinase Etk/Wzc
MTADLEATEAELENLAALQKEYRHLARERDETEDLYRTYFEKLAEARISNEMDRKRIANISIIQSGRVPLKPIRPKKVLYVAVGASVGLVLGCLAAFLLESLRIAPATASARPSPLQLRRS